MKKSVLLLFLFYFFVEASFAEDMAPANVIPDPAAPTAPAETKPAKPAKKSVKREIARHKKKKNKNKKGKNKTKRKKKSSH